MRRRDFLGPLAVTPCLPRDEVEKGQPECKMVGTGTMPYYPQETRFAAPPFSATFKVWRRSSDRAWWAGEPSVRWQRRSDGSTRITNVLPVLFGIFRFEAHYISDLRDGKLRGFMAIDGGLPWALRRLGLAPEGALVVNNGSIEETPIRPGHRENGSSMDGRTVPIGGVAEGTVKQLEASPWSASVLKIDGRLWPVKKAVLTTPEGGYSRGELHVWISKDLGVVLQEEVRSEGELEYYYRAVSLERGESS